MVPSYKINGSDLHVVYFRYNEFGANIKEESHLLNLNDPETFVKFKITRLINQFDRPELLSIDINQIDIKRNENKFEIFIPVQVENYIENIKVNIRFYYDEDDRYFYNDAFFYKQIYHNLMVNIDDYNNKIENINKNYDYKLM